MLVLAIDKDDSIIHVKDSERGKDYCCPECGETVRCRKGEINAHHFFHLNSDCQSNGESVVHKYFKQKIAELETIELDGILYTVTHAEVEKQIVEGLIADVLLILNGWKAVAFEVCYKHKKDEEHISMYRELGLEAYEVYVDMNEEQTDFEVVGTKTIYSVKQTKKEHRQEMLAMKNKYEELTLSLREDYREEFDYKYRQEIQKLKNDKYKFENKINSIEKDFERHFGMSVEEAFCRVYKGMSVSTLLDLSYGIQYKLNHENASEIILLKQQEDKCFGEVKFSIIEYDKDKNEIARINSSSNNKREYEIVKQYLIREWKVTEQIEIVKERTWADRGHGRGRRGKAKM